MFNQTLGMLLTFFHQLKRKIKMCNTMNKKERMIRPKTSNLYWLFRKHLQQKELVVHRHPTP